jgi:hypothetical protein
MIAAVGNGDGKDGARRTRVTGASFSRDGPWSLCARREGDPIHLTATTPGLSTGVIDMQARAAGPRRELR